VKSGYYTIVKNGIQLVRAHYDMLNEFYDDMSNWIGEGKIKWRETVFEGTEYAPKASCLSLREKILEKC
jgi:NADPH-dependent curcumin reductase CurA